MDFDVDRNTNGSGDPSLAEMTIKALRVLTKNPEGYFLFVEGMYVGFMYFQLLVRGCITTMFYRIVSSLLSGIQRYNKWMEKRNSDTWNYERCMRLK